MHMANLLASPTVSPSKSLPLRGRTRRVTTGTLLAGSYLGAPARVGSRHKLGRVVLSPLQEIGPAPQQEVVQGRLRVDVNVNEVFVRPHLQAHQQHSHVERSV